MRFQDWGYLSIIPSVWLAGHHSRIPRHNHIWRHLLSLWIVHVTRACIQLYFCHSGGFCLGFFATGYNNLQGSSNWIIHCRTASGSSPPCWKTPSGYKNCTLSLLGSMRVRRSAFLSPLYHPSGKPRSPSQSDDTALHRTTLTTWQCLRFVPKVSMKGRPSMAWWELYWQSYVFFPLLSRETWFHSL